MKAILFTVILFFFFLFKNPPHIPTGSHISCLYIIVLWRRKPRLSKLGILLRGKNWRDLPRNSHAFSVKQFTIPVHKCLSKRSVLLSMFRSFEPCWQAPILSDIKKFLQIFQYSPWRLGINQAVDALCPNLCDLKWIATPLKYLSSILF